MKLVRNRFDSNESTAKEFQIAFFIFGHNPEMLNMTPVIFTGQDDMKCLNISFINKIVVSTKFHIS